LEKQFQKLKLILEKEIPLDERKKLEYIDLRIENKVFYKFFQEESNELENSQKTDDLENYQNPKTD